MRVRFVVAPLVGLLACSRFGTDTPDPASEPAEAGADARVAPRDAAPEADAAPSKAEAYASAVLADGPIAYWRCREAGARTVRSEIAPANLDATLGASGPAQVAGGLFEGSGQCDFDGAKRSFGTASLAFLDPTYTLEAWFKPSADPDPDTFRHLFEHTNGAGRAYGVFVHDEGDVKVLGAEEFSPSPNQHRTIRIPAPSKDHWHHIVVSNGPKLFVDGLPVGTVETDNDTATFTRPFLWGSKSVDADASILGALTEIAVYAVALAPERIAAHYALGKQ